VASRIRRGELNVHGWVYKIETGEVFAYDPSRGQFTRLTMESTKIPAATTRKLTVPI
jgi:carbonic anhydrase